MNPEPEFGYCAVPVSILKRTDLTSDEKLLYSVMNGLKWNCGGQASDEELAEVLGCNLDIVMNSLRSLENKNLIKGGWYEAGF